MTRRYPRAARYRLESALAQQVWPVGINEKKVAGPGPSGSQKVEHTIKPACNAVPASGRYSNLRLAMPLCAQLAVVHGDNNIR